MFFTLTASLLASSLLALADPTPTTPGGGAVYNEGASCPIGWTADTTGLWKNMEIQLMSGANLDMVVLGTVATVDGTDASNTSLTYPCPSVSPNSPIYFYQFTDTASNATYWTTRFTIAGSSGDTTPAPTSTQPGGAPTPWGNGVLVSGLSSSGSSSGSSNSTAAPPTTSISSTSTSAPTSAPTSKVSTSVANTATHVVSAPSSSTSSATATDAKNSTSGASSLVASGAPVMAALAAALAML